MRIIRGFLKGKRFATPPNFPSRPTTDYAKEGFFNILENYFSIEDKAILDLCAGTGNISFEFVSRGAKSVLSIDSNPRCVQSLKINSQNLGIETIMNSYKTDCIVYCKNGKEKFDLIYADPPFHLKFHEELITVIFKKSLLKPEGYLVVEHGKQTNLSTMDNFEFCRNFGNVYFSFFKA